MIINRSLLLTVAFVAITFNTNTFAKDSIKYDIEEQRQIQRKMAISYAIFGAVSTVAGFPVLIKANDADDLGMVYLGAILSGCGVLALLMSGILFLDLVTEDTSSISESNPIIKHLQLGILPNAKTGYAGLKFNF